MISKLLYFISAKVKLTDRDTELCKRYFEAVSFPKNSVIEEDDKVPKYLYYIVSGYLRLYHYNESGEEVTTHINCPPGFFTSYSNFISQQKSNEKVECITACELLRITKDDLDSLTSESPAIKDFSIIIFQQSIAYNENRSRELAVLSAEQRYRKLMAQQPSILKYVPIAQIASFLGMKPESLSRIRKKIIN